MIGMAIASARPRSPSMVEEMSRPTRVAATDGDGEAALVAVDRVTDRRRRRPRRSPRCRRCARAPWRGRRLSLRNVGGRARLQYDATSCTSGHGRHLRRQGVAGGRRRPASSTSPRGAWRRARGRSSPVSKSPIEDVGGPGALRGGILEAAAFEHAERAGADDGADDHEQHGERQHQAVPTNGEVAESSEHRDLLVGIAARRWRSCRSCARPPVAGIGPRSVRRPVAGPVRRRRDGTTVPVDTGPAVP